MSPMKTFYNEDNQYLPEACELVDFAHAAIKPLFQKMIAEGFSARDIAHIIHWVISDLESENL